MKDSTLSMKVFAGYLATLSFFLLFHPSLFLKLGFENISGPWVPTLGYIVGALAFFYCMAVRENAKNFYAWTAVARLPLLLFFIVLVSLGMAPPIMLLIGFIDTGCAVWTALALKNERTALPLIQAGRAKAGQSPHLQTRDLLVNSIEGRKQYEV